MSKNTQVQQIDADPQCPALLPLPLPLPVQLTELISNILAGGIIAVKAILVIVAGLLADLIGDSTGTVLCCVASAINTFISLLDPLLECTASDIGTVIQNLEAAVLGLVSEVQSCLLAAGCPSDLLKLIVGVINGLLSIVINILG